MGDSPGDAGARTVAGRAGDLSRRVATYVFGRDFDVGRLAVYNVVCSTMGGLIGGAIGFGVGFGPGAMVGAVAGSALFDGLTLTLLTTSLLGESWDDKGAEGDDEGVDNGAKSDGGSIDSGFTTCCTEEVETAPILSRGLNVIPELYEEQ